MTPIEQDLARELAAHPAWRWAEGMRAVKVACDGPILAFRVATSVHRGYIPDLSDPATQGCILSMIGDVKIDACSPWVQWRNADGSFSSAYSDTLGEALARAWLEVKGKGPKP